MMSKQEKIQQTNTELHNAIFSQPALVPQVVSNLRAQLQRGIDRHTANDLRKLYIIGCGDSFFAGMATQLAFAQFAGIDAQAVEALDFARYLIDYAPADSALVAVSNSGQVSRTIEGVRRARGRIATWAVTNSPNSDLARAADWTLSPRFLPIPSGGTGTRSYLASLLSLYMLAISLGRLRGTIGDVGAGQLEEVLIKGGENIKATLEAASESAKDYAQSCTADTLYFVGGGPNAATAHYGAAKVMEALSLNGASILLEEWAHLQFHTTGPETPYVLVAPPGASYDRALEQAQGIRNCGAPLAVVVDTEDTQLTRLGQVAIGVEGPDVEVLTPLVYCVPFQLLAVELAMARKTTMNMQLDEHRKKINFQQIFHSNIVDC